jgi:hypothetical protein
MPDEESKTKKRPIFPPFQGPNYTLVPDEVFDRLLPELTGAELKVLLYVIRRTFGFKKDSDSISLGQMLHGITKRDGTIQDRGVGLSKGSLLAALRALQEMNLLLTERRQSAEKGNEPTVYRLNVQTPLGLETRPPLVQKVDQGVGSESRPSPWSKNQTTQETKEQDTEKQQHSVGVVGELTELGMTRAVAEHLAGKHGPEYLAAKIDLVRFLLNRDPKAVGKNPAGYLRRAIEDDYHPPAGYKTPAELTAEADAKARKQAAADAVIRAQEEQREQELQRDLEKRATALSAYRREYPPAQIPGTTYTTETAWQETLEKLRTGMTAANFQTWLKDTLLASCDGRSALIIGPNGFVVDWLRNRFSVLITRQLQDVLGFPVELEYLALTDLSADVNHQEQGRPTDQVDRSTQPPTLGHSP